MRRLSLSIALVTSVALGVAPRAGAQAADPRVEHARALFAAATEDEGAKRWADALAKLREVDAVKDTAGVRFHMANCEDHLGQLAEARADFIKANELAKAQNVPDVAQLAPDRVTDLEGRVPRLTIDVADDVRATAEVRLDGAPVPPSSYGTQAFVDPGDHRIEATAPGHASLSRMVTMTERHAVVFTVRLPAGSPTTPAPATTAGATVTETPSNATPAPSATSTTSAPPTQAAPPPTGAAATPASASASASRGPSRTAAVLTAVGGAALAGFGVFAFVTAGSTHDDNLARCATMTTSCDDLRHPVQAWDATALASWVGAAALGTVSVILFVSSARSTGSASTGVGPSSIALRVSPSTVALGGSF